MAFPKLDDEGLEVDEVNFIPHGHLATALRGTGADGAYNPGSNGTIYGMKHYTSLTIAAARTIQACDATHRITYIKIAGDASLSGILSANGANASGTTAGATIVPGGDYDTAASNGDALFVGTGAVGGVQPASPDNGGGGGGSWGAGGNDGSGNGTGGAGITLSNFSMEALHFLGVSAAFTGAGGGAGDFSSAANAGGGGAGIIIIDIQGNLTAPGTIRANGGNGADGTASAGAGGGAGAGAIIIRVSGNADFSGGTVTANGGSGGSNGAGDGAGGGGGGLVDIRVGGTYTAPTTLTANGGAGGAATGGTAGNAGTAGITRVITTGL